MIGPLNYLFMSQKKRVDKGSDPALEEKLQARGYLRFLACIAVPNEASISMHEKRGYVQVAHFPKIGYKFNKWHDIIWMQKTIDGPVRKIK